MTNASVTNSFRSSTSTTTNTTVSTTSRAGSRGGFFFASVSLLASSAVAVAVIRESQITSDKSQTGKPERAGRNTSLRFV
jgi:hypothetical protein